MDRERRVELPWRSLMHLAPPSQDLEVLFFRRWIESSWHMAPDNLKAALEAVLVRASDERPFFHYPLDIPGVEPIVYSNGEWVLCDPGGRLHYVAQPIEGEELDFLTQESYADSWNRVERLIPVKASKRPPIRPPLPVRDPLREPPWVDPVDWRRALNIFRSRPGLDSLTDHTSLPSSELGGDFAGFVGWVDSRTAIQAVRKHLESTWGFDPADPVPYRSYVRVLEESEASSFWVARSVRQETAATPGAPGEPELVPRTDTQWTFEPLEAGAILLRHGQNGLIYRVVPQEDAGPLVMNEDRAAYDAAWENQIAGLELCIKHEPTAEQPQPSGDDVPFQEEQELDLGAQIILAEYRNLAARKRALRTLAEKSSAVLDAFDPQDQSLDDLEAQAERFVTFQEGYREIEDRLRLLQDEARRLGYVLWIDEEAQVKPFEGIKFRGTSEVIPRLRAITYTLRPGDLYRVRRIARHWTEQVRERYRKTITRWVLGVFPRKEKVWRTRIRNVERTHEFLEWTPVHADLDPVQTERDRLEDDGFETYLFNLTDSGYLTADGESLAGLMDRCELDEEFRRRCAVLIPIVEESLSRGPVVTRLRIVLRPFPGRGPVDLPEVTLRESLSYRNAWVGTELGELVAGVNLAPGERRKVTVTRKVEERREETRSITSVLDVATARSSELASQIEREARSEKETRNKFSASASGSASWGVFSASGSASGSTSTTTKNFSRRFKSLAQKAARSIQRQTRQEVQTSTSSSSTLTIEESTSGEVENLNSGRSLNLYFYRLHNLFSGGVYLDELQFRVFQARELIAGTGIRNVQTFSRSRLPDLIEAVRTEWEVLALLGMDASEVILAYLDGIERTLLEEYLDTKSQERLTLPSGVRTTRRTAEVLTLPEADVPRHLEEEGSQRELPEEFPEAVAVRLEEIRGLLNALTFTVRPIEGEERLALPSNALYLDTVIGMQSGVEPFSDRMREAEYRTRIAETSLTEARAEAERARAFSLRSRRSAADLLRLSSPRILDLDVDSEESQLRIELSEALPQGTWELLVDGMSAADLPDTAGSSLTIPWDGQAPWWALRLREDPRAGEIVEPERRVRLPNETGS